MALLVQLPRSIGYIFMIAKKKEARRRKVAYIIRLVGSALFLTFYLIIFIISVVIMAKIFDANSDIYTSSSSDGSYTYTYYYYDYTYESTRSRSDYNSNSTGATFSPSLLFNIILPIIIVYGLILIVGSSMDFYYSCVFKRYWKRREEKDKNGHH